VQRIAAEAGVARSSFYVHFPDKMALLLRLTEDLHQESYELVSVSQQDDSANTPESLLTLYAAWSRSTARTGSCSPRSTRPRRTTRWCGRAWLAQLGRFANGAAARLRQDQNRGLAPADLDPVAATRIIIAGGAQAIVRHITGDGGTGDEAFTRELALIVWHGVFRRPAS
jgi:AcrR family transcriptional regulator